MIIGGIQNVELIINLKKQTLFDMCLNNYFGPLKQFFLSAEIMKVLCIFFQYGH